MAASKAEAEALVALLKETAEGGADVLWIETISAPEEYRAAAEAVQRPRLAGVVGTGDVDVAVLDLDLVAEARLVETVGALGLPHGSWRVDNLGIKVAALMTEAIVKNRLKEPLQADRVIVPGRSRMDLDKLGTHFGVPFERGPDELVDLPQHFGKNGKPPDLSGHDLSIFAEIIEAPTLTSDEIVRRASVLAAAGADVIDIGCQPDTPFPHLEDTVARLKTAGYRVSVDSGDLSELRRGALAGADFVLSLDETSLDAVSGTGCVPILVPKPHGDLASLLRAIDKARDLVILHAVLDRAEL